MVLRQWPLSFPPSGSDKVTVLEVSWPDGSTITRPLDPAEMNSVVEVAYPKQREASLLASDAQVHTLDSLHEL